MTGDSRRIGRTKKLLAEEVFQHLGTAIVNGDLAPNERIRDAELAVQLHVSRMPIREALQRLERIGLVTMYPSRYTEVTSVTDQVVADSHEFAAFQAGFVARLAAARMTDAERDTVSTLIDALDESIDEPVRYSLARKALFGRLSEFSGNALQHQVLREVSMALARNLRELASEDREEMLALHRALRDALTTGDADAAEQVSRAIHEL
ncbi:DNA-binding GntR family transcriptional regulator [Microbacterium sp. ZKA21]|uniref:GntR family transcriptional regulator n=1 Tax=Microbacterium sp. ZKA21 TaxID=3381694 RepID=UPI003D215F5A